MTTKFTPGPWTVDGLGLSAMVRGADMTIVAVRHRLPAPIHVANARLIAAAPNLHDFAADDQWQVIMGALDKWSREGGSELVALGIIGQGLLVLDDKRRSALRAARGEQGEG